MNHYLAGLGWTVVGLIALIVLNLIFFAFVVGLDAAFGEAPQFTVPLFVPLLVCSFAFIWLLVKPGLRVSTTVDPEFDVDSSETQIARGRIRDQQPSLLRSVLVIRRQTTSNFNSREKRSYETSI